MKSVVLKNITDKADELARLYNKTKDPKYKEKWYKLLKQIKQVKKMKKYPLGMGLMMPMFKLNPKKKLEKAKKLSKNLKDPKFRKTAKIKDYFYNI